MLSKMKATIAKYNLISPGELVIVAVSGGPDSLVLLHALKSLQPFLDLKLHVAHLNHMFRGEEANADADFVSSVAKEWSIPCTVKIENVPQLAALQKISPQEAGRNARYDFFYELAREIGADKIALGHQADDQVETVLMHFLRGSGLEGLAGMPVKRGKIIRPLLGVTRSEIMQYCAAYELNPRYDSSNLKSIYLRNKIRLELLQLLREYNPQINHTLLQTSQILTDENDLLDRLLEKELPQVLGQRDQQVLLYLEALNKLHPALKRRAIRYAYHLASPIGSVLGFDHVERVADFAAGGEAGKKLQLPGKINVTKSYHHLSFVANREIIEAKQPFSYPLFVPGETVLPELGLLFRSEVIGTKEAVNAKKKNGDINEVLLDFDKLDFPLLVRQRAPGDRFYPPGLNGSKKLKDYFIDIKLPRDKRDQVPLVVSGQNICWIVGFQIDRRFMVTDQTARVVRIIAIEM